MASESQPEYSTFSSPFSWLWHFLRLLLFLVAWTTLRTIHQIFCRLCLSFGVPGGFPVGDGLGFWRRILQRGCLCQHDLSLLMLAWITSVCSVPICKATPLSSFHTVVSGSKSRNRVHASGLRRYGSTSSRKEYIHRLFGIFLQGNLSFLPHLFI